MGNEMKNVILILSALVSIQTQAATKKTLPPVTTVESVDLQQYLGKWYEIAAIPQIFEKQCVGNTTAEYAPAENGLISVVNSCDTSSGQPSVAVGRAKVVDPSANAKLKVTFVNFFGWQFLLGGDYWILGIGENYSYAVVGAPGRDYAWILGRTPQLSEQQLKDATAVLIHQGYDPCLLISTVQASGIQERTSLCRLRTGN